MTGGGDRLVQAIILTSDLAGSRRRLEDLGFHVDDGGRHPGRGTANLIVPFGAQYLEVLAVVDGDEASSSPQGRPVLAALAARGPGLARWSVEPADIDTTATRLGLPVEHRQRVRPDGVAIRWRSVAVDEAWAEPWRCTFMAWDDRTSHPARTTKVHPNAASGFEELTVEAPQGEAALAGRCRPRRCAACDRWRRPVAAHGDRCIGPHFRRRGRRLITRGVPPCGGGGHPRGPLAVGGTALPDPVGGHGGVPGWSCPHQRRRGQGGLSRASRRPRGSRVRGRDRLLEVARVIDKRVGPPIAAECVVDHSPPPPPHDADVAVFVRDPATGRPTKKDRRSLDRLRQR